MYCRVTHLFTLAIFFVCLQTFEIWNPDIGLVENRLPHMLKHIGIVVLDSCMCTKSCAITLT